MSARTEKEQFALNYDDKILIIIQIVCNIPLKILASLYF